MASARAFGSYRQLRLLGLSVPKVATKPVQYRMFSASHALAGKHINYQVNDGVAVVTIDQKDAKVNVLNKEVMTEMEDLITNHIQKDDNIKSAVLISGKPGCFIAGADINMLKDLKTQEDVKTLSLDSHAILNKVANSSKPVVAAIMGPCLGGGLEVALACHYRIAVNHKKTKLGTPEVMLGILPGAGGTQRLVDLTGPVNALTLTTTGKQLDAKRAKKQGIVDQVVEPLGPGIKSSEDRTREYLEEVAIQTAKNLAMGSVKKSPRRLSMVDKIMEGLLKYDFGRNYVFGQARKQAMKLSKGLYPAPLKIIDVIETRVKDGKEAGYAAEAQGFSELMHTNEAKALMGLFKGQTECTKNNYGQPKTKAENLAVLGAGLMGAGIAQVSINNGFHVILKDMAMDGLTRGQQQIESNFKTSIKKKKMTKFDRDIAMSNLETQVTYDNFKKTDMVIEAVFEDIGIKHKVIKELEQVISPDCIIATNTSALPIKEIAAASKRPEKVIGMHYFSPVDKMQLMEIITTDQTSEDTLAAAVDVSLRQKRIVIVVRDGPGFYTTRALAAISAEVFSVLQEGMSPTELNTITRNKMGFPIGLATLVDEVGVDVAAHISKYLGNIFSHRFGNPEAMIHVLSTMVAEGNLGRKSGRGMFLYEEGGKGAKPENPKALEILKSVHKPPTIELTAENVSSRLLSKFVNEAVICLEENILRNPIEGDIGMVFGLGFPPNLGGPFRYIDNHGADKVVAEMERLQAVYGDQFAPCQLLKDHAKDPSKRFHPL